MARRVVGLPKSVLIPVCAAFAVALILLVGLSTGFFAGRAAPPGSPTAASASPPMVHSTVVLSDNSTQPTASPRFPSVRGDAILAWVSLFGQSHVATVTDSGGDSFRQVAEAGMAYGTTGAYNALAVWAATDSAGGSAVTLSVTAATTCTPCAVHIAIVVVDVSGGVPPSIDQVGPMVTSSALPGQESRAVYCSVLANASDLVLGGVAARNLDHFTSSGPDSVVDQVTTVGTGTADSMTMAVLQAKSPAGSGATWVNTTDNQSSAWVAGAVSLHGSPVTARAALVVGTSGALVPLGIASHLRPAMAKNPRTIFRWVGGRKLYRVVPRGTPTGATTTPLLEPGPKGR